MQIKTETTAQSHKLQWKQVQYTVLETDTVRQMMMQDDINLTKDAGSVESEELMLCAVGKWVRFSFQIKLLESEIIQETIGPFLLIFARTCPFSFRIIVNVPPSRRFSAGSYSLDIISNCNDLRVCTYFSVQIRI